MNLEWKQRGTGSMTVWMLIDSDRQHIVNWIRWSETPPATYVDFKGRHLGTELEQAKIKCIELQKESISE